MSVLKKSGYGDGRTAMIVDHFATHVLDTLILPSYARSEVHEDKRTEQARANLWKLEAVCMHDHQRYFTFDVSELDGSDGLRGDTAQRDGIQKEIHDIQGAYEKYRKQQERMASL